MSNALIKDSHQASMNFTRKSGVCDWAVQAIDRIIVMATWVVTRRCVTYSQAGAPGEYQEAEVTKVTGFY